MKSYNPERERVHKLDRTLRVFISLALPVIIFCILEGSFFFISTILRNSVTPNRYLVSPAMLNFPTMTYQSNLERIVNTFSNSPLTLILHLFILLISLLLINKFINKIIWRHDKITSVEKQMITKSSLLLTILYACLLVVCFVLNINVVFAIPVYLIAALAKSIELEQNISK